MKLSAFLFLCATCAAVAEKTGSQLRSHVQGTRRLEERCTALVGDVLYRDGGGTKFLACRATDGTMHNIPSATPEWIEEQMAIGKLVPGQSQVEMPTDQDDPLVDSPPALSNASTDTGGKTTRRLAETEGNKSVLVVRVVANNVAYGFSEAVASDKWFGTSGDPVNLASQYSDCSHGKLNFAPTGAAPDGTISVELDEDLFQATNFNEDLANVNLAYSAAFRALDGDRPEAVADHVVFCMPPVLREFVAAWAFIDDWLSVYSDEDCNLVTVQMHELGHNMNLAHSGEGGLEYGDRTGVMGNPFEDDAKMCFNGAKFWQLGWFSDQSLTLYPLLADASQNIQLLSFTRYDTTASSNPVVVKIDDSTDSDIFTDYFMVFNRKTGINFNTQEAEDTVSIVRQSREGLQYARSWVMARLGKSEEYTIPNFAGSEYGLKISVNDLDFANDIADVDVEYLSATKGTPRSSCNENLFQLSLFLDQYPGEISWKLENTCTSSTIDTGGGYTGLHTLVEKEYCLPDGEYAFTILDTWGDGILDPGSYSINFNGEKIVDRGTIGPPGPQLAGGVQNTITLTGGEGCTDDTPSPTSPPGASGDPHFKTHAGEMYDFHGGCDLVLMDNPDFKDGLGMLIHIRTKIETWWSYVESAVVRIGDETVEIAGGNQGEWLFINGTPNEPLEEKKWYMASVAGLHLRYKQEGGNGEARIYFGNSKSKQLHLTTFGDFVKVNLDANQSNHYSGSHGLLGRFPDGKRVARDGETFIEDVNKFGQEWQVKPEEPRLFRSYDSDWVVPAGQKCAMPQETAEKKRLRQRRLAEGIPMAEAEKSCAHLLDPSDNKACIFDVVATQDISMAGAW